MTKEEQIQQIADIISQIWLPEPSVAKASMKCAEYIYGLLEAKDKEIAALRKGCELRKQLYATEKTGTKPGS